MLNVLNNQVYPRLEAIIHKHGYYIEQSERSIYGLKRYRLPYVSCTGGRAIIKIEINYLSRVHVMDPCLFCARHTIFDSSAEAILIHPLEIMAEKTGAFMQRCKPRDVYDLSVAENQRIIYTPEDAELYRRLTIFHAGLHDLTPMDFENTASRVLNMPFIVFRDGVLSMIRTGSGFFDTKQVTKDAVSFFSRFLSNLTKSEKHYLESWSENRFLPGILFPEKEGKLLLHPRAQNKICSSKPNESNDRETIKLPIRHLR